jgi:hypothetical protein
MRKSIYCAIIIALVFISCKVEVNETNVVGTWSAKSFESTIPGVPPEYAEAGEKEFLSSIYTLNADNSFKLTSNFYQPGARGRWELDAETNVLVIHYEMGSEKGIETYVVKKLYKNRIVLFQNMPEASGYVQITLVKK